jgi:hypothetical protein
MRGAFQDFVKVTAVINVGALYTVTTDGRVNDIYLRTDDIPVNTPDLKFAYTINDLGWYSYKIVVKQTEQEYYNVYLPGILNGYPGLSGVIDPDSLILSVPGGVDNGLFPTNEANLTAHTVLFNDNINKIPRDLAEVGPDQKQFRSSVTLYGMVTNIMGATSGSQSNVQYYPRISSEGINAISHTSTAIAQAKEFNMGFSDLSTDTPATTVPPTTSPPTAPVVSTEPDNGNKVFYQIDTNPLIARISTTEKSIGWENKANTLPAYVSMLPFLAVYETAPFESNIDIYWETTSAGLIVDLNSAVLSDFEGIIGTENLSWDFNESYVFDQNVTSFFGLITSTGQAYLGVANVFIDSVVDGEGIDQTGLFSIEPGASGGTNAGKFKITYKGSGIVFNQGSEITNVYTFVLDVTTAEGFNTQLTVGGEEAGEGALANKAPTFDTIAPVTINATDSVVLPASAWVNANAKNGTSIATGASNLEGLVYRLSGTGYPDNWTMNPVNGEITQTTPNNSSERGFQGNPSGIYGVVLELIDADAMNPVTSVSPSFSAIKATQSLNIKITYAPVNAETVSNVCVLDPNSNTPNPAAVIGIGALIPPENEQSEILTRYYYISENEYTNFTYFTEREIPGSGSDSSNISTFRLGTKPHLKGTVVFSVNDRVQSGDFLPSKATFWYREVPDPTDLDNPDPNFFPLLPSLEYNRTGENTSISNALESREQELPTDSVGNSIITVTVAQEFWRQSLRAFDYQQIQSETENVRGIEYVVQLIGIETAEGALSARSWVHVDDLHYPTCVPWQGQNIVTLNGNVGDLFKYTRSSEASGTEGAAVDPANVLFAETPYGEYVNEFYTTNVGNIVYTPADNALPYINFELDLTNIAVDSWTKFPSGASAASQVNLRWVAAFPATSGRKSYTGGGVGAIQTTTGVSSGNNTPQTPVTKAGTLKIRKR